MMKKYAILILCCASCLGLSIDWNQPQLRTLVWNYTNNVSPDISFNIYSTTNIAEPLENWKLFTNVYQTNMTIKVSTDAQDTVFTSCYFNFMQIPQRQYFAMKAYSAFYKAESVFSNVTNTPAAPLSSQNLLIQ